MTYNSLTAFDEALNRARIELPSLMVADTAAGAARLAISIRKRVSETGADLDGGTFSSYSNPYKAKKRRLGRSPLGTITAYKNFYLSGDMWNGFGEKRTSCKGSIVTSNIGFTGKNVYKTNAQLNEIHSDKEDKGIAYSNEEEEERLVEFISNAIFSKLEQML